MPATEKDEFPYDSTTAARMLTNALRIAALEYGLSLRAAGKRLGYKQPVVLSHMATGRVPIPIDRAVDIAEVLHLKPRDFLGAVLRQRHPEIPWDEVLASDRPPPGSAAELVWSIEAAAGKPVAELNAEQLRVMREVAAAPDAARRWLTVHEVPVIEMLRRVRPDLPTSGIDQADTGAIEALLEGHP